MMRRVVVGLCGVLVLAGCAQSVPPGPVRTAAASPYACAGVPLEGLETLARMPLKVAPAHSSDDWANSQWGRSGLLCDLEGSGGYASVYFSPDASVNSQDFFALNPGVHRIESDQPGVGGWLESDGGLVARWWCGPELRRATIVRVYPTGEPPFDGDGLARYMISLMPWACGDTPVPPATDGLPTSDER